MYHRYLSFIILIMLAGLFVTACGSSAPAATPTPSGDASVGKQAFTTTCSACHGPDAKGMTGLGKDLTTSAWVKSKTDAELIEFMKVGRPASDPLNTTKVDMPPKGGNPALTETDMQNIVAFIRSINK